MQLASAGASAANYDLLILFTYDTLLYPLSDIRYNLINSYFSINILILNLLNQYFKFQACYTKIYKRLCII
jgi:hypothetical protein